MLSPAPIRRALPDGATVTHWTSPDGWRLRRFEWAAPASKARGSLLFQGGRGDIFEKYLEIFAHWREAGWAITSIDWRGQAGSGRTTDHLRCGDIPDFAMFIDDLRGFGGEWMASGPGPHVAVGHSMGGYLLLRAMAEGAFVPDAAVLVAPMLGLKGPGGPRIGEAFARLMARFGPVTRPAWKGNERPHTLQSRQKLLTHDASRYADELFWHEANPEIVTGPPSWRWVIEAFRSTRELREGGRVPGVRVPVLGLVAEADGLVDPQAALSQLAQLPDAQVIRFGNESAHEILREADPVRDRAIAAIDAFLDARAPAT